MLFPAGQELGPETPGGNEEVACDAVVVGSGAGGAAAAWVLANAGLKVAMLEEGRRFDPAKFVPKASWAYRNLYAERSTRLTTGNAYIPLTGGRAVGGSTVINSGICFRTPDKVLGRWRDEFGIDWAQPERLSSVFDEVEHMIGKVKTHPSQARANSLVFKEGADRLGYHGDFISRSTPGCVGCGVCQLGCPVGGKGSVDRNFLPSALARGMALFSSARVQRILVENGAARGVEAQIIDPMSERPMRTLRVTASKVFLCAGPIGSPLLLLRQGLCKGSGQVGKNLRMHPASGLCARFPQVIDAWDGATQGYFIDLGESMLETFSSSPDLYYTQAEVFSTPLEQLRHIASCGVILADESSGEVTPASDGRSKIRYVIGDADKNRIVRALRIISRCYFAAGANAVHPGIHDAPLAADQGQLEALCHEEVPAERLTLYASHPMGTCRMGSDPRRSVVAPSGQAHDLRNLYVADASVLPTSLGVNPQVTVMSTAIMVARGAIA